MMTPTVVRLDGQVRLVLGTGGSERIRSAIVQVLSNLLDFRMRLQEAVDQPRVHLENGTIQCEAGYDPEAMDQLEAWGYPVNRWPTRSIYFGGVHSVSRTKRGRLVAAARPLWVSPTFGAPHSTRSRLVHQWGGHASRHGSGKKAGRVH